MQDQLRGGTEVTRFNYNRPKWFGGFFGFDNKHNTTGNCRYDAAAMGAVLSPQDLNRLVEPMYLMTPVLAYHLSITIFLAFSLLLTLLQQGFYWLVEFAFLDIAPSSEYLHTLGVIWYVVWALGLLVICPLYFVAVNNIEQYFRAGSDPIFEELRVQVKIKKDQPGKFVLIEGFKKIDALEIVSV
jgi:hypothetical protein